MVPGLLVAFALAQPAPNAGVLPTQLSAAARKDAMARFGVAVLNLRRDRLLTAAKQLEEAAKLDPDATAPLRELVRVYTQIGREPDAIRVARQVLRKNPTDADTAHTLAKLLFDVGELKEAVAAAKLAAAAPLAVDRADKSIAIYRDLATLCEKAGEPDAAEIALRKAVELLVEKRAEVIAAVAFTPKETDSAAADCLERLGKVLVKQKKYDEAATAFQTAAKLYADPRKADDALAAARLGWNLSGVLQAKGEPAAALGHLETFLKLKPTSPEPYARFASLMRDAGRGGETVGALRRFVEADAKNPAIRAVLGAELARDPNTRPNADVMFTKLTDETNDPKVVETVVRSHLDNDRAALIVADLDRIFTLIKDDKKTDKKDDTPEVAAKKAFAAERARIVGEILRGDSRGALAVLKAAGDDLRLGVKRTHQVHAFLGHLAARHHRLEFAATLFREGIRNAPRETQNEAFGALIDVLWLNHKPAEVAEVCREALRNNSNLAPHYLNFHLAWSLADTGDANGALAAADLAIDQSADSDRLIVRLGKVRVLRTLEKWDDAIALCKKLLDEFDSPADRTRTRFALSAAYWGAKKPREAEAELRAILDVEPDHAAACNELGYHLADQGRNFEEAEQLIRRAIAADRIDRRKAGSVEPENAAYIDSLGWVLFRQGKLPEARAELERATAMPEGANSAAIWDHLGDVLFRLNEKAKAKAAWEKAVELYETESRSARGRHDGRLDEVKRKLKRVP